MKRTLSDWASIAEILGAVAIIISLIFVGLEIRNNTAAVKAATFQNHMSNEVNILHGIGSNPDLARIYIQYLNNRESLSDWEQKQGYYLRLATYRLWEDVYLQRLSGTLSDEGWDAFKELLKKHAKLDMALEYVNEGVIQGAFAEYIRSMHARKTN